MKKRARQKQSIQQSQYSGDREKLLKLFELLIQIDKSINKKKND
jgi:hypothetical protein